MADAEAVAQDHAALEKQALVQDEELIENEKREHCRKENRGTGAWAIGGVLFILLLATANLSAIIAPCNKGIPAGPSIYGLHKLAKNAIAAVPLLRNFQVYPPVLTPSAKGLELSDGMASQQVDGTSGCVVTQTLMSYSFGNSYGQPFVGPYSPPSDCSFNRVTFNLTVVSAGRQFDRLAIAYFGDTELWRTSTAEPTQSGIVWTYIKDMSSYLSLFKSKQTLIFDLGNIINDIYTAPFNATLQATFFTADNLVKPADLIVPISARQGSKKMGSAWQYPTNASNSVALPRNIHRAVFSVSATGQSTEEFWYSNVLTSDVNTFGPNAGLLPYSPFRETQVYIDGQLAGVAWPFPIIFTGGIVPGFWRPIVGIDAFDLREDEVDLTPWLAVLCDGQRHTFEIRVAGIADNGNNKGQLNNTVGSYWVLTGKIFLWLDTANPKAITTGTRPILNSPGPAISLSSRVGQNSTGGNETLAYSVNVTRDLAVSSTIKTSAGSKQVIWRQHLEYSNRGLFTGYGTTQYTQQTTSGLDIGSSGPYVRHFSYPITVNTTIGQSATSSDISIDATLARGQDIQIFGQPIFPTGLQSFAAAQGAQNGPLFQGSVLSTSQNGSAHYQSLNNNKESRSSGATQQRMTFTGLRADQVPSNGKPPTIRGSAELYQRNVLAVNASVVRDQESLLGRPFGDASTAQAQSAAGSDAQVFAGGRALRELVGRGPAR